MSCVSGTVDKIEGDFEVAEIRGRIRILPLDGFQQFLNLWLEIKEGFGPDFIQRSETVLTTLSSLQNETFMHSLPIYNPSLPILHRAFYDLNTFEEIENGNRRAIN